MVIIIPPAQSEAQVEAEIAIANARAGYLSTMEPTLPASGAIVVNTVYLTALNTADRTAAITGLTHIIGATNAGANVDAGLYTYDGSTFSRIRSTGPTAAAAINTAQRMAFTSYTPQPGERLFAAWAADAALTVFGRGIATIATVLPGPYSVTKASAWSSGLPLSIASPAAAAYVVQQIAD